MPPSLVFPTTNTLLHTGIRMTATWREVTLQEWAEIVVRRRASRVLVGGCARVSYGVCA